MVDINQSLAKEYCKSYSFPSKFYFNEKCLGDICKYLKKGYIEMGNINLYLAELGIEQDIMDLCIYESQFLGSDKL